MSMLSTSGSIYSHNIGDKVFVGNLPFDATETELWSLFGSFGNVTEVVLLGSGRSKSGQGCAFVRFGDLSSGIRAIEKLNGTVSLRDGDPIAPKLEVRIAKATKSVMSSQAPGEPKLECGHVRLFVGNLPLDVTVYELETAFRLQGVQLVQNQTFVMSGKVHTNLSVCAFVVVSSMQQAEEAIKLIDSRVRVRPTNEQGLCMRVRVAHDKSRQNNTTPQPYYGTSIIQHVWDPPYGYSSEPSFLTYHPYMMMPQSSRYGPSNIVPGDEPWRNDGIYSLRFSSNPRYMGNQENAIMNTMHY